jgi:threonine dehydratase
MPVPAALEVIWRGAHDVVEVTDAEVEAAMRAYFDDTHQLVEGAGAAPMAALLKSPRRTGKRMGVILTGGNIDRDVYVRVLEDMSREPAGVSNAAR